MQQATADRGVIVAAAKDPILRRFTSEHGEALEEIVCPLCSGAESTPVLETKDMLYGKPGPYRLVRCRSCTLAYLNPRPTFAALAAHYPDDYHCYVLPHEHPAILRPLAKVAARGQALRRLRFIEGPLGRVGAGAEIVDVGCGVNEFLRVVKEERGPTGIGVDFKDTVVSYIRDDLKMPVAQGTLAQAQFEPGRFDLVTMMEYLEHEMDPYGVLSEARRVLKKGGHIAIEIPDIEGWPARAFKHRWANLDLPRHLVFFERKTLELACSKLGFEIVSYNRFAVPFYIGISVLFWLGCKDLARHRTPLVLLGHLLGVPFVPALPWIPEFTFVVARAV